MANSQSKTISITDLATVGDKQHRIKVRAYYSKGRGYYVSADPVTYEKRPGDDYGFESFLLFSNCQSKILDAARFSKKTLDSITCAAYADIIAGCTADVLARLDRSWFDTDEAFAASRR
jgi:hypothetical protein